MKLILKRKFFSSSRIISIGFLAVILVGTFLLMLPISSVGNGSASFIDALFTSVSAVCVTGLTVQNTALYWTGFGHAVILLLIQIGGMGIVTIAVSIILFSGKKINLMQRTTMAEAISANQVGGVQKLTSFAIKIAALSEALGALIMSPVFIKQFGFSKGVWYSVFHSVSAFCNAGFDILSTDSEESSLMFFADNPMINITIILLIVAGGIGFAVWEDIYVNKFRIKKYRMQTKTVLVFSAVLILLPALYFFFIEFSYAKWDSFSDKEKILSSLFQSVTTRTAGFNTVDLTKLSEMTQFIMIVLMIIGGSPGSTAGGMKTTTVAVLLSNTVSVFKRREDANLFGRRIPAETIRYAGTILMMYIALLFAGGIIICGLDNVSIVEALFEAGSAIGTVGLTLGITQKLSLVSRIVLICLMFFGRVGGLTLVYAAVSGLKPRYLKFPQEKITVG